MKPSGSIVDLSLTSVILRVILILVVSLFALASHVYAQEICDNGIDDDMDNLIDLNDPDCDCELIEPISYIPNPSFEELNCCPSNRSQMDCATGWIQASEPTTDFIHECGWGGWDQFPPPKPFPDGQGIMGFRDGRVIGSNGPEPNWKEYAGACLTNPLLTGVEYRFEFELGFFDREHSPAISITFFGTTDCDNLPFGIGNSDFGCPTNDARWQRLSAVDVTSFVGGAGRWIKSSIDIIPEEDIYAIAIGPPCSPTSAAVSTYYFFDNLILDELAAFEFRINEQGHPCEEDFTLYVAYNGAVNYQWYKDGIALVDETEPELSQIYGPGKYQVRLQNNTFCGITQFYNYEKPVYFENVNKVLCDGDQMLLGDRTLSTTGEYKDTITSKWGCDSIVLLSLKINGVSSDTISASIFPDEEYNAIPGITLKDEGDHLVTLASSVNCDSLLLVQLKYHYVYFPNVFSPNNDEINDWFIPFGSPNLKEVQSLKIFDRWGNKVFDRDNVLGDNLRGWNGVVDNREAPAGVYTYVAIVEMKDSAMKQFSGSVILMR